VTIGGKISRRDFIKIMGAGALGFTVLRFIPGGASNPLISGFTPKEASAQSAPNPWTLGPSTSVIPVHVTLLQNNKLLLVQGSGNHLASISGPFLAGIFDPQAGLQQSITLAEDLFCCGNCLLPNGNVLHTGGTKAYDINTANGQFEGLPAVYEYDITSGTFNKLSSLAAGKWYPTQLVLADGRVMNLGGLDDYGINNELTEVYDPATKKHTVVLDPNGTRTYCVGAGSGLPGSGSPCFGGVGAGTMADHSLYPRMHLMPSGMVFMCGQGNNLYLWNPSTGVYTPAGSTILPHYRTYGTSYLLPLQNTTSEKGTVLICGGNPDSNIPATNTSEILDFNSSTNSLPVIKSTGSLNIGRAYVMPVILPTGEIMIFGGTTGATTDYVYTPEMYDPVAGKWSLVSSPMSVGRTYHSCSLLLTDGRIITIGGTPDSSTWESRTEIYTPWYLNAGSRPVISGTPLLGPYNTVIKIPTPDPSSVSKVSLLRMMSVTHHYEPNQRLVWLQILQRDSSSITVKAPISPNIAPPGPYLIHVLNSSNVPSAGAVVMIPGTSSHQPYLSVLSPTSGAIITGPSSGVPLTVTGTAASTSGYAITSVKVGIDSGTAVNAVPAPGGDWSSWSYSALIATSGQHSVTVTATDGAGNTTTTTFYVRTYFS
jgi:hypothetical protein